MRPHHFVIARRAKRAVAIQLAFFAAARLVAADVAFNITDDKGAPVADAVVSLVSLDATPALSSSNGAKLAPPAQPLDILQQGREFAPYVTPLRVGTAVNFQNRDTVQHQVYSSSAPRKFELPLYAGEAKEAIVFDKPGVVAVGCNIHDWMIAYVVVLETPWFAKTAATGAATISAVPPGRYRAEVWQPRLAKPEVREVTVADAAPALSPPAVSPPNRSNVAPLEFKLALKPDRRIRRAPATSGGGYK